MLLMEEIRAPQRYMDILTVIAYLSEQGYLAKGGK
jgi:hypothetical protein